MSFRYCNEPMVFASKKDLGTPLEAQLDYDTKTPLAS